MTSAGTLSEAEAKRQAMTRIRALRYGTSGYFAIIDKEHPTILMNAINPKLDGTDVSSFTDSKGTLVFIEAIDSTKENGSGFSTYLWPKPGAPDPVPKLTYNLQFKPWNWMFMTGVYIDDLHADLITDLWQSSLLLCAIGMALSGVVVLIIRNIERSVGGDPEYAKKIAGDIAAGDLSRPILIRSNDSNSMLYSMGAMQSQLASTVGAIRVATDNIATASSQIASGNLDLSSRTEQQAAALEETASSMEELTSTVKHNGDNAQQADVLAKTSSEVAIQGGKIISEVVLTMHSINASAKKIVDIISVVDGIAFQTNILALNAAVEAARAGEQGRGFAVVASEVRTLAQRSAAAAKEIKTLINDSVEQIDTGNVLVNQAGKTMTEIVESVRHVTDIMGEISAAGREQEAGIQQIGRAITEMDTATQQNAALVEQAAAAAESLQQQARNLAQVVRVFKLSESTVNAETMRPGTGIATLSMTPKNLPRLPHEHGRTTLRQSTS